jgi:hypothetical protein
VITAKEANRNPFAGYSASLAQGLGHIASTRPSLGLPNNSPQRKPWAMEDSASKVMSVSFLVSPQLDCPINAIIKISKAAKVANNRAAVVRSNVSCRTKSPAKVRWAVGLTRALGPGRCRYFAGPSCRRPWRSVR